MTGFLEIDGSHGEGGGALLRTCIAVSALTQQPVRIVEVRGATRKPGLTAEDLAFLKAAQSSCRANVEGARIGELELAFEPTRPARGVEERLDVHSFAKGTSPGNALIIAESLMALLARGGSLSQLVIQGETYNNQALSFDAFEQVTLEAHRRQGLYAQAILLTPGYGYGSRGEVQITIEPSVLEPIEWRSRGELFGIRGLVRYSELSEEIAQRGADQLRRRFSELERDIEVEVVAHRSHSPGLFITIWAEFERGLGSGGACGQKGVRVEKVADQAISNFLDWIDTEATVDAYLADQLLVPAVFAQGKTVFSTPFVTRRLQTMVWAVKQFLPAAITIVGQEGFPGLVTIDR